MLTADHPVLKLLADTLRVTSGPAAPEDIAGLLGHAMRAEGYELVPGRTDVLDAVRRVAHLAAEADLPLSVPALEALANAYGQSWQGLKEVAQDATAVLPRGAPHGFTSEQLAWIEGYLVAYGGRRA